MGFVQVGMSIFPDSKYNSLTLKNLFFPNHLLTPRGGYSQNNLVGVYGPLPIPLVHLRPKSAIFLPFLQPDQKFNTLSMIVAADTVALNVIFEGVFLMVLSTMMKKSFKFSSEQV